MTKFKSIKKFITLALCSTFFINPMLAVSAIQASAVKTAAAVPSGNVVLKGGVSLSKGSQKVAVSLRDSDVKQVLRMFADKAGLNIVFHNSVEGKITLDLVNVTLNDAFNMIMEMAELTYTIENDTLLVASAEKSKELNFTKQAMMSVPVKYAKASDVAEFLNTNIFTSNRPGLSNTKVAVANTRTNDVLILGSQSDYLVAKNIVAKLDLPQRTATYKVNHTTPAEMAQMLCDTFFSDNSTSDAGSLDKSSKIAMFKNKFVSKFKGTITGAAESSSSITLGGATVACTYQNDESSGSSDMVSLKNGGIKVLYQSDLGVVKLIGATQQQEEQIAAFIKDTDKKQPQAYVEMSIVELNEQGSKDFQSNWGVYSNVFSGSVGGSGLSTITSEDAGVAYPIVWNGGDYNWVDKDGTLLSKTLKWHGTPMITQQISYLITNSKGRVLANPKIMITNGKTSTIDLSSDYAKTIKTEIMSGTGALAGVAQRTVEVGSDSGLIIELTPFISPDGYVSLNIKPEYATIKGSEPDPQYVGGILATYLQRRNLELNNVRIKDGETLVLAGLIQETETKSTTKTPILGDLPFLGVLFRSSLTKKEKSELVIMITPHIIKDSEDLVNTNENISL